MIPFSALLSAWLGAGLAIVLVGFVLAVYTFEIIVRLYVRFKLWQLDREFRRMHALRMRVPVFRFDKSSGNLREISSGRNLRDI